MYYPCYNEEQEHGWFGRGLSQGYFFMMGPVASCSQVVRNDVVKRKNVQVAEKKSRGRHWILCSKGRFGLTWRTVIHAKLRQVFE